MRWHGLNEREPKVTHLSQVRYLLEPYILQGDNRTSNKCLYFEINFIFPTMLPSLKVPKDRLRISEKDKYHPTSLISRSHVWIVQIRLDFSCPFFI